MADFHDALHLKQSRSLDLDDIPLVMILRRLCECRNVEVARVWSSICRASCWLHRMSRRKRNLRKERDSRL